MAQKPATLAPGKRKQLERLIETFEQATEALFNALNETVNEWRDQIQDRSERWRESAAGEAAIVRMEALEAIADEQPDTPNLEDFYPENCEN